VSRIIICALPLAAILRKAASMSQRRQASQGTSPNIPRASCSRSLPYRSRGCGMHGVSSQGTHGSIGRFPAHAARGAGAVPMHWMADEKVLAKRLVRLITKIAV
jgi:hypothetical protein